VASARLSRFLTRKTLEEYVDSEDGPKAVPRLTLAQASPANAAAAVAAGEATVATPRMPGEAASGEAASGALRSDGSLVFAVRCASLGWGVPEPLMDPKTAKQHAKYGGGGKGGGKGGGRGGGKSGGKSGGKGAPGATPAAVDLAAPPPGVADPVCLRDLTFSVRRGALVAVVGPVGSGKSSLLAALTGEMQLLSGSVGRAAAAGQVALAAQVPWVVNSTLRENVTFGAPFEAAKYVRVRNLACLEYPPPPP
jgi:ABC-type multidrug transport system fused ATPase/permease subunit